MAPFPVSGEGAFSLIRGLPPDAGCAWRGSFG